jgi:uncharacterized protein
MLEFELKAIVSDPEILVQSSTVYLFNKEKNILLPIRMASFASDNLLLAKDRYPEPRPHIHNTASRLVRALGGRIERVIISGYHNEIFYSYIRIKHKKKSVDIDAKPSDSMAIALRLRIPIFVEKRIYESAGIQITKELLQNLD